MRDTPTALRSVVSHRSTVVAILAVAASLLLAEAFAPAGAATATPTTRAGVSALTAPVTPATAPSPHRITFVQANINKDMGQKKFVADMATVFAADPDIITFNEVHNRPDEALAPPGYAMFRTPGHREGWAPVVWKTDVWTAINQGTVKISKRPAKFTSGMVGVRFANWVTLVNTDGETVSVISTHIAPNSKDTKQLLVPSLKVLSELAVTLSQHGPVLLGGDFNMGYRSARYQPELLQPAGLRSTFDLLKEMNVTELNGVAQPFSTHRGGGIIDYLFVSPAERFIIEEQYPVLLNSDHRMLVVELSLVPGTQRAAPRMFSAQRYVIAKTVKKAKKRKAIRKLKYKVIRKAPPGSAIHVASREIRGKKVFKVLTKAHDRGVNVTVIIGEKPTSKPAKKLKARLGNDTSARSWFVRRGKAWGQGKRIVKGRVAKPIRQTEILASISGNVPALALTSNATLGTASFKPSYRRKIKAGIATDLGTYNNRYLNQLAHVGRGY